MTCKFCWKYTVIFGWLHFEIFALIANFPFVLLCVCFIKESQYFYYPTIELHYATIELQYNLSCGCATNFRNSLLDVASVALLLLHRETRQNGRNNWLLIHTYIPVISITKLNFFSCVGLSLPSFLTFILYHFISSNFRCNCQSFQRVDLELSHFPSNW
jgi:hypothetical protein